MKIVENNIHRLYAAAQWFYSLVAKQISKVVPFSPLVLRIRLTGRCNLNCSFCYQKDSRSIYRHQELDLEHWKRIIDHLPKTTVIDITGGEPFLWSQLPQLLEYLVSKKRHVSLITNGTICSPEIFDLFTKKPIFYFMVSLDGPAAIHDQLRGVVGSFEKTLNTIMTIKEGRDRAKLKHPILCVKMTICDQNICDLFQFAQFCFEELKIDQLSLNFLFTNPARGGLHLISDLDDPKLYTGNIHRYQTSPDILTHEVSRTIEWANEKGYKISLKPEIKNQDLYRYFAHPEHFSPENCQRYFAVTTIDHKGNIYPCDLALEHINIRQLNFDLRKYWRSESFISFSRFFDKNKVLPACQGCCLAPHCNKE